MREDLDFVQNELQALHDRVAAHTATLDQLKKSLDDNSDELDRLRARHAAEIHSEGRWLLRLNVGACLLLVVALFVASEAWTVTAPASGVVIAAAALFASGAYRARSLLAERAALVPGRSSASRAPLAGTAEVPPSRLIQGRAHIDSNTYLSSIMTTESEVEDKLDTLATVSEHWLYGPTANPVALHEVLDQLAQEWRSVEATRPTTPEQRLRVRVEITVLRARASHHAGFPGRALRETYAAYIAVERHAGGRDNLLRELSTSANSVVSVSALSVVAAMAPAVRAALPPDDQARLRIAEELRGVVEACLPRARSLAADRQAPALVQVMYLLTEQDDPRDRPRLRALAKLIRPQAFAKLNEARLSPTAVSGGISQDPQDDEARTRGQTTSQTASPSFANGDWA